MEDTVSLKIKELEKRLANYEKKLSEKSVELEAHEGLLHYALQDVRKMYEELLKSQAQLIQSDKLATIGLLTAGIVHEINNPLATLQLALPMLQDHVAVLNEKLLKLGAREAEAQESTAEMAEFIHQSRLCADTIAAIVKDIKVFARSDKGAFVSANVNTVLESVVRIAWNAMKNRVDLQKNLGEVPEIRCNPQQLSQVFLNLLVNASQAIEKKGIINLRTYADGAFVKVEISDNGCGIPEEIRAKIFEPFFTTKGEDKGTGLGLSITRDIVQKHGGTIEVESEVGRGTRFTVSLPLEAK